MSKATDVQNEKELHYSHAELTPPDAIELGERLPPPSSAYLHSAAEVTSYHGIKAARDGTPKCVTGGC